MASVFSFFTKPLQQIAADDVQQLIEEHCPEGYEVEYKKTVPDKAGGVAPWLTGKDEIGNHARDVLLSELVAFANSGGGYVLLGIEETEENPPKAKAIEPIPRVGDLATRIEDQVRSCIEPPLSRFDVKAVETDGKGGGVLILHTGASHRSPHRLTTTRESYVRRGSSTVKMTMREIQDMTLNVARGIGGIEATFGDRKKSFHEWDASYPVWSAFRVTAVPLQPMPDPGRMFGRQEFLPPLKQYSAVVNGRATPLHLTHGANERPILRGVARYDGSSTGRELHIEQYQNGVIDIWSRRAAGDSGEGPYLHQSRVLGGVANALALLDNHRKMVGAPSAEYALETEITRSAGVEKQTLELTYVGLQDGFGFPSSYTMTKFPLLLPRVTVGERGEFERVINIVDTDIFDALGERNRSALSIAF